MTPEQRTCVIAETYRWVGTPWHHQARVRGAGVDCIMLLCEVYEACGLVPHITPDHYPIDIMMHKVGEPLLPIVMQYGVEIDFPDLGDIVLYRFGHSYSHAAIYVGANRIIHANRHAERVIETEMDEGLLLGRPRAYFTLADA